ncbi:MAG: putative phage abortive infection protein, partial [Sulfuricurvum sp.]
FNANIEGYESSAHKGRKYITLVEKNLVNSYLQLESGKVVYMNDHETYDKRYNEFLLKLSVDFETYFRIMTNILEFIDNSNIENQDIYLNIFIAQLSDSELYMIFFYSISKNKSNFLHIIKKYNILKNLKKESINYYQLLWEEWYLKENFHVTYNDIEF